MDVGVAVMNTFTGVAVTGTSTVTTFGVGVAQAVRSNINKITRTGSFFIFFPSPIEPMVCRAHAKDEEVGGDCRRPPRALHS